MNAVILLLAIELECMERMGVAYDAKGEHGLRDKVGVHEVRG